MAAVVLGQLWLSPASDLTAGMPFAVNSIDRAPAVQVASRAYGGAADPNDAVYRMIRTPGRQKTSKVTLGFCTDDQSAQLEVWQGLLLCYRDPRGEKFFGFYTDSVFTPRFVADSWSVPLTVQEVTWDETA